VLGSTMPPQCQGGNEEVRPCLPRQRRVDHAGQSAVPLSPFTVWAAPSSCRASAKAMRWAPSGIGLSPRSSGSEAERGRGLPARCRGDRRFLLARAYHAIDGLEAMTIGWAYEFRCARSLNELRAILNQTGPWEWTARDSYWYGDYLISRPFPKVRVRIHEKGGQGGVLAASAVQSGSMPEAPPNLYTVLVDTDSGCEIDRAAIDSIFLALLRRTDVQELREIEHYD